MTDNNEVNWWDEVNKQKVNQNDLEDGLSQLGEFTYQLVENSVNKIIENDDEEEIKKIISPCIRNIHSHLYKITLCECWMESSTISSVSKDFYESIKNGVVILEHTGLSKNKIIH